MSDYLSRLITEKRDLQEKKDKLKSFLESPKLLELSAEHQTLLHKQLKAMETYLDCLNLRLQLIE